MTQEIIDQIKSNYNTEGFSITLNREDALSLLKFLGNENYAGYRLAYSEVFLSNKDKYDIMFEIK